MEDYRSTSVDAALGAEYRSMAAGNMFCVNGLNLVSAGVRFVNGQSADGTPCHWLTPIFKWDAVRTAIAAVAETSAGVDELFIGTGPGIKQRRGLLTTALREQAKAVTQDQSSRVGSANSLVITPSGVTQIMFREDIQAALGKQGLNRLHLAHLEMGGGAVQRDMEARVQAAITTACATPQEQHDLTKKMALAWISRLTRLWRIGAAQLLTPNVTGAAPPSTSGSTFSPAKIDDRVIRQIRGNQRLPRFFIALCDPWVLISTWRTQAACAEEGTTQFLVLQDYLLSDLYSP